MIVLSDNTATNLVLNRITGNAVNARMGQLGLQQTRVMRKILGDGNTPTGVTEEGAKPENKKWGTGRSSPQDMLVLLERLYRGELVSKEASDEMIAILKRQRDHNCIGRNMKDVPIASKSGSLDHLRSDVGIVYSKHGPIAMAITVEDIHSATAITENHACCTVGIVDDRRHHIRAYYHHSFLCTGLDKLRSHLQRIQERGTCGGNIKYPNSRRSDLVLNQAGRGRKQVGC